MKVLATPSRGEPTPKAHTVLLKRLRRTSRTLSRKVKGSANRRKAQRKLARLHARIANIRKDARHRTTRDLVKTFNHLVIEDLNVRGMARNRHLARSIMDGGFGAFRRQLADKARFSGATIVVAIAGFPQARPVLAAALSNTSWLYRNEPFIAMIADLSATAT